MIIAISIIGTITVMNLFLFFVIISANLDMQKMILKQSKDIDEIIREINAKEFQNENEQTGHTRPDQTDSRESR